MAERFMSGDGFTLEDFVAYMPQHNYFFIPTREPWPAASVSGAVAR